MNVTADDVSFCDGPRMLIRIRAVTGQHSSPESCLANKTKMFLRQFCRTCANNDQLAEEAHFVPTTVTVKGR